MTNEGEIRWEIDMASVPHQNTTYRSPEIRVGGLKWQIAATYENSVRTGNVKQLLLSIDCKNEYARELWNCEHRCSITVINKKNLKLNRIEKFCKYFTNDISTWSSIIGPWEQVIDEENGFIQKGKIEVEAKIKIISNCADRDNNGRNFSESDELSDICIVVGGQKLNVSKTMLAVHSPVFKAMFFSNFEEANKSEVEIKEVEHNHFVDFLNIIYTSVQHITDQNVGNILTVADRFQVKFILDAAESFLMHSTKLKITKKLELSETYKLNMLQVHLLRSFTKLSDIKALEFDQFFVNFSDSLKGKICYRTMELIPKNLKQ